MTFKMPKALQPTSNSVAAELVESAQDRLDSDLIDEVIGEPRIAWRKVKAKRGAVCTES